MLLRNELHSLHSFISTHSHPNFYKNVSENSFCSVSSLFRIAVYLLYS